MAQIKLKGNPVETLGNLAQVGEKIPDFLLTKEDLSDVRLKDFAGKKKIVNIFPSLDTGVCAASVRRFNDEIKKHPDTLVLNVSNDLPFAMKRFCSEHNIDQAVSLSNLRRGQNDFGKLWGVELATGPMAGLLSRAVVVLDAQDRVLWAEQVPEITQEPDYAKALAVL